MQTGNIDYRRRYADNSHFTVARFPKTALIDWLCLAGENIILKESRRKKEKENIL